MRRCALLTVAERSHKTWLLEFTFGWLQFGNADHKRPPQAGNDKSYHQETDVPSARRAAALGKMSSMEYEVVLQLGR